jgi:hypothetical protein
MQNTSASMGGGGDSMGGDMSMDGDGAGAGASITTGKDSGSMDDGNLADGWGAIYRFLSQYPYHRSHNLCPSG